MSSVIYLKYLSLIRIEYGPRPNYVERSLVISLTLRVRRRRRIRCADVTLKKSHITYKIACIA